MYKSPIDIILGEFELKFEDGICKAVRDVGIVVDKDELIKALKYDRDQYDKGYSDALADMKVTRCEECYLHGKCVVEDVFNTARMPDSKMFCAIGRSENDLAIRYTADRCVCCGDVIPEGRQVCPGCEGGEPT